MATATKRKSVDYDALRQEWIEDVTGVVSELEGWLRSHPAHPEVRRTAERVSEQYIGEYDAPGLNAIFGGEFHDAITVSPLARNYPGRGLVEITSWPNLRRVQLRHEPSSKKWSIYTDSNIPLHQEWNQEHFHRLFDDLLAEL